MCLRHSQSQAAPSGRNVSADGELAVAGPRSSPTRPARSTGRTRPARRRRSAPRKRLELRRARRVAAALRHRGDAGAAGGADRALCAALVIALGDSFHDGGGPARLADTDRATLAELQRGRDWIWIAGNHDPDPAEGIGGRFLATLALGPLTFRHEPAGERRRRDRRPSASGRARLAARPHGEPALLRRRWRAPGHAGIRRLCRRPQRARPRLCGGVRTLAFTAHMLGERRLYAIAATRCLPD